MNTNAESQALHDEISHMHAALTLARRGLGDVWPNPAVGCVLVNGRRVVGRGWTQFGGRPHAETEALRRAGPVSRGATAYISLEPCDHHGETAPCTEALISSGISRAVIAIEDPDTRVCGRGEARLRAAGIAVDMGVCRAAAAEVNAGFLLRVTEGRPLVTLKVATTLDGRIATGSGDSRWITGDAARIVAHRLRAEHDAVIVGSNTALADDPELTCRLPGMERRSPVRIVLDGRLRVPSTAKLVRTAHQDTDLGGDYDGRQRRAVPGIGCEERDVDRDPGRWFRASGSRSRCFGTRPPRSDPCFDRRGRRGLGFLSRGRTGRSGRLVSCSPDRWRGWRSGGGVIRRSRLDGRAVLPVVRASVNWRPICWRSTSVSARLRRCLQES